MELKIEGTLDFFTWNQLLSHCRPVLEGADSRLEIDISDLEWCFPGGVVPLVTMINLVRRRGIEVVVTELGSAEGVISYLSRMNFFSAIGMESPVSWGRRPARARFIEITQLRNPSISGEVSAALLGILDRVPENGEVTELARSSFIAACGELVDNIRHAYPSSCEEYGPAFLQAQFYPTTQQVHFCIADCGIGIKASMEGATTSYASHLEAITSALASRNRNEDGGGAGLGLSVIDKYVSNSGGFLGIQSGDAFKYRRSERIRSAQGLVGWGGTIVSLDISVASNADLSAISRRYARSC